MPKYTDQDTGLSFDSPSKLSEDEINAKFDALEAAAKQGPDAEMAFNTGQAEKGAVENTVRNTADIASWTLPGGLLARAGAGAGNELLQEGYDWYKGRREGLSPAKIATMGAVNTFMPKSVVGQTVAAPVATAALATAEGRKPSKLELGIAAATPLLLKSGVMGFQEILNKFLPEAEKSRLMRYFMPGTVKAGEDAGKAGEAAATQLQIPGVRKTESTLIPMDIKRNAKKQFASKEQQDWWQSFGTDFNPQTIEANTPSLPLFDSTVEHIAKNDAPYVSDFGDGLVRRYNDSFASIQMKTGLPTYDLWKRMRAGQEIVDKSIESIGEPVQKAFAGIKRKDMSRVQTYLEGDANVLGNDNALKQKADAIKDIWVSSLKRYDVDGNDLLEALKTVRAAGGDLEKAYPAGNIPEVLDKFKGAIDRGTLDLTDSHALTNLINFNKAAAEYVHYRPHVNDMVSQVVNNPDAPDEVKRLAGHYIGQGDYLSRRLDEAIGNSFTSLAGKFGVKLNKAHKNEIIGLLNTLQYSGTMGGRMGPIVKNLFNGFQTGAPIVGNSWYFKGVKSALSDAGKQEYTRLMGSDDLGLGALEQALETKAKIMPRVQKFANDSMANFSAVDSFHNRSLILAQGMKVKNAFLKSQGDVGKFIDLADLDMFNPIETESFKQMYKGVMSGQNTLDDITRESGKMLAYDTQWSRMVERIPVLDNTMGKVAGQFTNWPTHYGNYISRYYAAPGEEGPGLGNFIKGVVPGLASNKRQQKFRTFLGNNIAIAGTMVGTGLALGVSPESAWQTARDMTLYGPLSNAIGGGMGGLPIGGPAPNMAYDALTGDWKSMGKQAVSMIPRGVQATRDIPLYLEALQTGDTSKLAQAGLGYRRTK